MHHQPDAQHSEDMQGGVPAGDTLSPSKGSFHARADEPVLHPGNHGAEPHLVVHALQAPVADEQLPAEAEDAQAPVTEHAAQGQAADAVEEVDSAAALQGTAAGQPGQGESSAAAEAEQEAEPPPQMSLQAHEKGNASGKHGSVAVLQCSEQSVPVEGAAYEEVEWEGEREAEPSQQACEGAGAQAQHGSVAVSRSSEELAPAESAAPPEVKWEAEQAAEPAPGTSQQAQDSHNEADEAGGGDEELAHAASLAAEQKAEEAPEMSSRSHSSHKEANISAADLPGGQPLSWHQGERSLPAAGSTGLSASAHGRRDSTATEASDSYATPRSKLDEPVSSPDVQCSGQLSRRPHTPGESKSATLYSFQLKGLNWIMKNRRIMEALSCE